MTIKTDLFSKYLKQFLELWNALKPFRMWKHFGNPLEIVRALFENPLWNVWGEKCYPILLSLSTCWRMRDSTICYKIIFSFSKILFYRMARFWLIIAVERSKDITHAKLLPSFGHLRMQTSIGYCLPARFVKWMNFVWSQVAQARYMSSSFYVDLCIVTWLERFAYL